MPKFDIHFFELECMGEKAYGYAFMDLDGKPTSVVVRAELPFEEWKKKVNESFNV